MSSLNGLDLGRSFASNTPNGSWLSILAKLIAKPKISVEKSDEDNDRSTDDRDGKDNFKLDTVDKMEKDRIDKIDREFSGRGSPKGMDRDFKFDTSRLDKAVRDFDKGRGRSRSRGSDGGKDREGCCIS